MQVSVAFRHLEPSEAVKAYTQEKLEKIQKYFPEPISAHAVLTFENHHEHNADVQITLHHGILLKAVETTEDMYSSIDLAVAKIERQVRKYKDRIRDHRPHKSSNRLIRHRIVAAEPTVPASSTKPVAVPKVFKEEKFIAQPLTLNEAIMQLHLKHEQFLCFQNAATHEVNVIYIRSDGAYGLIEANHQESTAA